LDRTEKRAFVASLAAAFAETSFIVVSRNAGMTVAEVTDLRRRMRASGATYKVAKNRLATRALEGTRFDSVRPLLRGPTALAWSRDPVAVAKTAVEFARINEKFVVLGGALGPQLLNAEGIKALSELPSLEALRAGLLGMLQTPASRIVGVLQAPGGQIARVLAAFATKDSGDPDQAQAA
jgi:large subunit ribosomal protein L10